MKPQTRKVFVLGCMVALLLAIGGIWILNKNDEPSQVGTANSESTASVEIKPTIDDAPMAKSGEPESASGDSARDEWVRAVVAELMRQNDARSVTSAALLMARSPWLFKGEAERVLAFQSRKLGLILKSAEATPPDRLIQTLALSICMNTNFDRKKVRCDQAELSAALQKSDPSNVLAWVHPLTSALKSNDTESLDIALANMSAATELNTRGSEIDAMLRTAVESARVPPPTNYTGPSRLIDSVLSNDGATASFVDLASISKVCGVGITEVRAVQCARIAKAIAVDDNLNSRRRAWEIASQLPPSAAHAEQINDAKRSLRRASWQRRQFDSLQKSDEVSMRVNSGDASALQEMLIQNGATLEPPAGWNP